MIDSMKTSEDIAVERNAIKGIGTVKACLNAKKHMPASKILHRKTQFCNHNLEEVSGLLRVLMQVVSLCRIWLLFIMK